MDETRRAWGRVKKNARALLAQTFLGWALDMDADEVINTVAEGMGYRVVQPTPPTDVEPS